MSGGSRSCLTEHQGWVGSFITRVRQDSHRTYPGRPV